MRTCFLELLLLLVILQAIGSNCAAVTADEKRAAEKECSVPVAANDAGGSSSGACLFYPHERDFYINGSWVSGQKDRESLKVIDPSTADAIATVSLGNQDDTNAAVASAREAFSLWSLSTVDDRRQYVKRLLKIYKKRRKEMAKLISMEMGAPIDFALDSQVESGSFHIQNFLDSLEHFEFERRVRGSSESSTTIFFEPVGVVAMITPWNWPMNQITLKVIPALLVGCTCILKPSELTPLSALLFAEMIHEADFPPGVFSLLNGDGVGVGTQLSQHTGVDMVSFTGSTRAGALVSRNAADTFKRVSLELGGKGANIIFDDVASKLKNIIRSGVWDCFSNSGQSCNAPTRMMIQASLYEQAVRIAKEVAEAEEVKPAYESGDHMGPVVSAAQYEKIQRYIQIGINEGATLVTGGLGRAIEDSNGFYVKPTIFSNVTNNMRIAQEEIFGPVLCILSFESELDAIRMTNESPYGLTNYVHTNDGARLRRMARSLRSGMVELNGVGLDDGAPFGGMKASGNGREGGVYGLEEFCEIKAVSGLMDEEDD